MQKRNLFIILNILLCIGISNAESIKSVNKNLGALVKQINSVNNDLSNKQKQKNDLNKAITDSNNAIDNATKLLKQLQATRAMNLQEIKSISEQLPNLTDSTNNSKQQVQLAINKIYKQLLVLQQESSSILSSNSNLDNQRKKVYLSQLLKFEEQKYQNLKAKLDSLTVLNTKLQTEVSRLDQQLANTAKKQEKLRAAKQDKLDTNNNLEKQIAKSKNELSNLKQQQAKLNDLVVQLRQSQVKVSSKSANKSNVGSGAISRSLAVLGHQLTNPVEASIAIGFGDMRDGVKNSGLVYHVSNNAHVYAISSGTVLYSGVLPGFGQLIVIDNGNDYNSVYSGVISVVKKGQQVNGGQVIASSGVPSNQPMGGVYFELRHLGKPINPTNVFR